MTKLTGLKSFLRKEFVIGLEIGSTSIKLVQLARREEHLVLARVESKEIPASQVSSDPTKEKLQILKEMLHGMDLGKSKLIVAVNCPQTTVRVITVPPMPRGELKEVIRYEAKNYFPFSLEDSSLDFEILGETLEKGAKKHRLLVAVSPRTTIEKTLIESGRRAVGIVCVIEVKNGISA